MPTIPEQWLPGSLGDRTTDTDRSALVAGAIGALTLAGVAVGFLVQSSLTAVFLLGFLVVVGFGWYAHQAETAKALTFLATAFTVAVMGLIIVFLFGEAWPVFELMGLDLITRTNPGEAGLWDTASSVYSLTPMIWGTVVTTILAMAIAGPLGIASAVFLAEIAPGWLRDIVKPGVEILAGIPSIVYGWLGFIVINGYFSRSDTFDLASNGSLVVAGMVIGLMALPTVVSVAEDALTSIPESMKSGSLALGSTEWQTTMGITIPAAFSGVSAAVLLGVGRAVGETMAATVILANVTEFPGPLFDAFDNTITLTSVIANQYGVAQGLHLSALFGAGVVLFVTVLFLSIGSQLIEERMERNLGGNQ